MGVFSSLGKVGWSNDFLALAFVWRHDVAGNVVMAVAEEALEDGEAPQARDACDELEEQRDVRQREEEGHEIRDLVAVLPPA